LFTSFALGLEDYTALLAAVTGFDLTPEETIKAGERIWNLERLWNIDLGVGPEEDKLPERFLKEPLPEGAAKGQVVKLQETLPDYYRVRGWDEKGYPTEEKLKELGLK
jgi:aldehyde:ferredoxin oxidoreductase